MVQQFLKLEWKAFIRSSSFSTNIVLKIFMILGALYFMSMFLLLGFGSYHILEKAGQNPFDTINSFALYYLLVDLVIRFFFQKMPTLSIRPFLNQNVKKNNIVRFVLNKTMLSFFNFIHWFFFIPFTITLVMKGYTGTAWIWCISMLLFVYINNFLAILIDKKDAVFYTIVGIFAIFGVLQYYSIFDISLYSNPFFASFYKYSFWALIPIAILALLYYLNFKFFKSNLYLDAGLSIEQNLATTENLTFLDQFGKLGTFLKNDIRLLKRNKRAKTTLLMSVMFLFYGLLFFTNSIEAYNAPVWKIFAGIFVSGGFLFNFGQFVPSWDSSYYPLMMTQNITYKDYLSSKWWLMVIATTVSTLLASLYLFFGIETYLAILTGAIFNIGVNSHLVLLGGAYIKTPIDLTSNKNAFGDKKAFNVKTLLISLPKLLLPMLVYAIGHYTLGWQFGYLLVALLGILGFAFKNKVFQIIESIYKKEKYITLEAYKQKG
ncbi:hypothetical protein GOQ30_13285 [Flavobacterium sp. TP390]|uniref:Uncharacterized protein n=1 Tax=Flavobacterium profundi TaxID=1774945 RepID=A0A6I4ITD6_9FLAO|nr:DUF5687 family protein [Flavobacterium profundi]MVO10139.1 hypothetical protein [Flavobacterium profundi]